MANYCLCGPAGNALQKLGLLVSGEEPSAITFMGTTLYLDPAPSLALQCHESVHRRQELRYIPWWGKVWPLKAAGRRYSQAVFLKKYIAYFKNVGYEENPFEIEAFNAEKRFAKTGKCE